MLRYKPNSATEERSRLEMRSSSEEEHEKETEDEEEEDRETDSSSNSESRDQKLCRGISSQTQIQGHTAPNSNYDVQKYFHRIIGLGYLSAFVSLLMQWESLYSPGGLLPVHSFVSKVRDSATTTTILKKLINRPSLLAVTEDIGLSNIEGMAQSLLLVGIISSIIIMVYPWKEPNQVADTVNIGIGVGATRPKFIVSIAFVFCWMSYLSLQLMGQTFLSFQWDILLLECGFLCIFTINASVDSGTSDILVWLHRFLAWKLMFLSGCVKLQSGCKTWERLTALEYHFATQPLPTPLSWYAHQLPPIFLRLGVLLTIIIEIPLTFFLLLPNRNMRKVGAIIQILLQVVIAVTGNYTFFNVLTVALMLQVYYSPYPIANAAAVSVSSSKSSSQVQTTQNNHNENNAIFGSWQSWLIISIATIACCIAMLDMNHFHDALKNNTALRTTAASREGSGQQSIFWLGGSMLILKPKLWSSLPVETMISSAVVLVLMQVTWAWLTGVLMYVTRYFRSPASVAVSQSVPGSGAGTEAASSNDSAMSLSNAIWKMIVLTCSCALTISLIFLSTTTLQSVSPQPASHIIPAQFFRHSRQVDRYQITSSYGLFRSMTGVYTSTAYPAGTVKNKYVYVPSTVARPEIELQGLCQNNTWHPIHFAYKPGSNLYTSPSVIAPLQPRLDWQMWFAALGNYQNNPWLVNLAYKLMTPDNEHIWKTLNTNTNREVWKNGKKLKHIPRLIRMQQWDYSFTFYNTTWASMNVPERTHMVNTPQILNNAVAADTAVKVKVHARKPYWFRSHSREYLGELNASNPSLHDFLTAHGLAPHSGIYQSTDELYSACRGVTRQYWVTSSSLTLLQSLIASVVLDNMQRLMCSSIYLNHCLRVVLNNQWSWSDFWWHTGTDVGTSRDTGDEL